MKSMSTAFFTLMILLVGACSSNQKNAGNEKNQFTRYNDAEIANVLTTVNDGEIKAAQQVLNRGTSEDIRDYAQEMIDDHRSNNKKTKALMVEADMDLSDSSIKAQTLALKSKYQKQKLEGLSGKKLDKEYIQAQVETHKEILKDLRETLIPSAGSKELKSHLEETANTIEEHLEHAQKLERKLI